MPLTSSAPRKKLKAKPVSSDASGQLDMTQAIAGVESGYYPSMFGHIDSLGKKGEFNGNTALYTRARYLIANYCYLVYERLEKKILRDINIAQVKDWTIENRVLVRRLLTAQYPEFEIEAFDRWLKPDMQIQKMAMYNPSNRMTKNTFH